MVRLLGYRIRGYAGTRASARQRTRAEKPRPRAASAEADGFPKSRRVARPIAKRRAGTFLAGAILRFQCLERAKARGKTALYSSQSSATGVGRAPGGLDLEQLPPLSDWRRRKGRNRIALDGEEAGSAGRLSHGAAARLNSEPALRFAIGRATPRGGLAPA